MKETYFVIGNSDGDTTVREYTKEQLLREIEAGEYKNVFSALPNDADTNYWGEGVLIIKGTVVTPKPVEVITKYKIE